MKQAGGHVTATVNLEQRQGHLPLRAIHIVSDAGLHFRSYESLHHHLVELPRRFQVPCFCHWGIEKHMKSRCDQMFGWLNGWITRAKRNGASILSLEDLLAMAKNESAKQQTSDPNSKIVVLRDESAKPAPGKRLLASDFHISRTYCVGAHVANPKIHRFGVRITNYIFSGENAGVDLTASLWQEDTTEAAADWRRGFYGAGESSWRTNPQPLGAHEETALTRRQNAQQHLLPHAVHVRHRAPLTEDELAARKQAFLERKMKRKNMTERDSSSSSSDTSSSSADDVGSDE